jgi:hypothetical protein
MNVDAPARHQEQHVISEWLLKAFASNEGGRWSLQSYDKATGTYATHFAHEFMVELDGHSNEIEVAISGVEGPAADAARRLVKRVKGRAPGIYALLPSSHFEPTLGAPPITDRGVIEGMRLFVLERSIAEPSLTDRRSLARFAGLMYQRAPKTENAILRWGEEYDRALRAEIARRLPGMTNLGTFTTLAHRRSRLVPLADRIANELEGASWWVVRAAAGQEFVLSDSPVVSTLALGHDDGWRPILAGDVYAVVMALSPHVALLMAPKQAFPLSQIEIPELGRAINTLLWRAADRYVLARSRHQLEDALPGADEATRRWTMPVQQDRANIERRVSETTERIIIKAFVEHAKTQLDRDWRRWAGRNGCELTIGFLPYQADDRDDFPGIPPRCSFTDA